MAQSAPMKAISSPSEICPLPLMNSCQAFLKLEMPFQTKVLAVETSDAALSAVGSLLAQTLQAEAAIKFRIAELECQAQLLRVQLEQTTAATHSLRGAMSSLCRLRVRWHSGRPITLA